MTDYIRRFCRPVGGPVEVKFRNNVDAKLFDNLVLYDQNEIDWVYGPNGIATAFNVFQDSDKRNLIEFIWKLYQFFDKISPLYIRIKCNHTIGGGAEIRLFDSTQPHKKKSLILHFDYEKGKLEMVFEPMEQLRAYLGIGNNP